MIANFSDMNSQTSLVEELPLPSFHKNQSEETWNTDLPRIPFVTILQSTDNFSVASKLGEGGFGPVYKVVMILSFGYRFLIFTNFYLL